jgi:Beta propeller domain
VSDFDSRARKAADAVRQQIAENASDSEKGIRRAQRSPARVAIPSAVAAAVALIVGVVVVLPHGGDEGTSSAGPGAAYAVPGALQPFDTCDTVLQYFKDQAPEYLIERAGGGDRVATDTGSGAAEQRTAKDSSNTTPESASTPQDYSTTNVQEAGVDEPDIVKTDGKRIVAVAQARVHLVGLDGGKMTLRKTLPDTMVRNVFLSGDRVLVFSGQTAQSSEPGLRWAGQQAVLTMYDISDLSDPQLIAKLTIDGNVLDARLVGTQVRVVTISSPDVNAPAPVYAPDGGITEKSKEELRAAVASTHVDDWIPTYALQDGAGGEVSKGRLVECANLAHPETFSGLDTVAVSAFDIGSAVPTDSGPHRRRSADICDRHLDVCLNDRLDPRRFSRKDESAQVRHRVIGRKHLPRIRRDSRNLAESIRDV